VSELEPWGETASDGLTLPEEAIMCKLFRPAGLPVLMLGVALVVQFPRAAS
jgi:hypothetical protein